MFFPIDTNYKGVQAAAGATVEPNNPAGGATLGGGAPPAAADGATAGGGAAPGGGAPNPKAQGQPGCSPQNVDALATHRYL